MLMNKFFNNKVYFKNEIVLILYLPYTYLILTFYILSFQSFVFNNHFLTFYLNLKVWKEYRLGNVCFLNKKLNFFY